MGTRKKALFIGGSLNQTSMLHRVAQHLPEFDCWFTPFYGDGVLKLMTDRGLLDFTVMGGRFRQQTEEYLRRHRAQVDYRGATNHYDLVVTCQDLIVQKNIRNKPIVLVQEGMTDPENLAYHAVRALGLPRFLASTAATGLSHAYRKFCVASEGYRHHFIRKGVKAERIEVTGIPNFDDVERYRQNDFPYRHYVLVATSDARETFKYDNRPRFLRTVVERARGRRIIVKLHPNERVDRATREIRQYLPGALIYTDGDINPLVANCDVLITQYSSVAYVGLALGKEVYSYFDVEELRRLLPIQNGGTSARNIAEVCRSVAA